MLNTHYLSTLTGLLAVVVLPGFFLPLNGQDCAFRKVVHHSIDREELKGLPVAKVIFDRDKFYVFHSDTNLYSLIELGKSGAEQRFLNTCDSFRPNTVISGGGMTCFLDYENKYMVTLSDSVGNGGCLDVSELDRKYRGRWLTRFRNRRPLRFDGKHLSVLINGGVPAPGKRATKKFYEQQNIIASFDLSGGYERGFARYDSIFAEEVNIDWAREMYAAFCAESREYFVGSYITPGVTRYNAAGEYLGRSVVPKNSFNQVVKPVKSNKEQIFLGLKYDIEHDTFGEILIDHSSGRLLRFYFEAEEDTARPDMDFLHLLFFGEDLDDICLRPNPILDGQSAQFFAMPLKILVYDLNLNFQEVLETDLDRSAAYAGSDSDDVHYFVTLTESEVVITGYSLTCAE